MMINEMRILHLYIHIWLCLITNWVDLIIISKSKENQNLIKTKDFLFVN